MSKHRYQAKKINDIDWHKLAVKTREIVYAFFKHIRGFLIPVFQRLDRRDMSQRFLRNLLVVDLDVV